ncbi:uncharacterized protein LOC144882505 isoform X2 [Branchiostoma floridae x Branchiostoma japonicum]
MSAEKLLRGDCDGSHHERAPGSGGSLGTVFSVAVALVSVVSLVTVVQDKSLVTCLQIEVSSLKIQLEVEQEQNTLTQHELMNLKERLLIIENENKDAVTLQERLGRLETQVQDGGDLEQNFSTNEESEFLDSVVDEVDQDHNTSYSDTPWQLEDELHDRAKRSSGSKGQSSRP